MGGQHGPHTSAKRTAPALLVAIGLLAACGSDDPEPAAAPTTAAGVTATVDWVQRVVELDGFDAYTVEFCDGDAPLLCVSAGDQVLGVVELLSRPDGADDLGDGPEVWAAELVDALEADRREGCDPQFRFEADETVAAPVAGHDGFRYAFTGSVGDRVVERVVGHGAVVGGDLHLLVLNGLADDGCLARESELPLAVAVELEPVVAALAAGSRGLPDVGA